MIHLICSFLKTDDARKLLRIPLIINCKDETWRITRGNIEPFPVCNHEEADTRMIFHASLQTGTVVIDANDSDVFFLLAYTMTQTQIRTSWYQKIEENQVVDIRKICDHLGDDICSLLPQLHAITGCDQTSYKHNVGKLKVMYKILKDPSLLHLIKQLGQHATLTDDAMRNLFFFVQTVLYGGNRKETYVETRVRLYKGLKNKSSLNLPADPDSMTQEIKRCHLQAYVWLRCLQGIIPKLDPDNYGWRIIADDEMEPIWFTGHQFPPSLRKANKTRLVPNRPESSAGVPIFDADVNYEHSDRESDAAPPKKRRKPQKSLNQSSPAITDFSEYDADIEATDTVDESENETQSDNDEWESDFITSDEGDSSNDDYWP